MQNLKKCISNNLLNKLSNYFSDNAIINIKGEGWDELIYDLHRKLIMLDQNYKIAKITSDQDLLDLKIVCRKTPPAIYEAIKRYTSRTIAESQVICIDCGDSKYLEKNESNVSFFCKNCKFTEPDR
jgi:hypothetical protein